MRTITTPVQRLCLFGVMLLVIMMSGCMAPITPRGEFCFSASDLPQRFAARPRVNAQTLDLTQLAGPVVESDRICPGDVLDLSVGVGLDNESSSQVMIRVDMDGMAFIPDVNRRIRLGGLFISEAEQVIGRACIDQGLFRRPNVVLSMKVPKYNQITVIGAVNKPGKYNIRRESSSLLDAFVAAGALANNADTDVEIKVPVSQPGMIADGGPSYGPNGHVMPASARMGSRMPVHGEMQSIKVDLVEAINSPGGGQYLPDGSVVYVKKREPKPVQVLGLVSGPGQYAYPVDRDLHLLELIAQSGGVRNPVADKILVIRTREDVESPIIIRTSYYKIKRNRASNLRLEPGDVVSVERTPQTVLFDLFNRVGAGTRIGPFGLSM